MNTFNPAGITDFFPIAFAPPGFDDPLFLTSLLYPSDFTFFEIWVLTSWKQTLGSLQTLICATYNSKIDSAQ